MRRNRLITGVMLALALSAVCGSSVKAQTSTATKTAADAEAPKAAAYTVGSGPEGVVYDGANVWALTEDPHTADSANASMTPVISLFLLICRLLSWPPRPSGYRRGRARGRCRPV